MLGGLSAAVYAVVVWLSWQFEFVDRSLEFAEMYVILRQRPIVPVLVCFAVLFGLYLLAQRMALKCSANRSLVPTIFGFAIGFRLLLLASDPIQEIDIYRYVWDGAVVRAGVSPFRYSPRQVLAANDTMPLPDDLGRLVELRDSSPALHVILRRVHFGHLPTVYPSVSQAVFAAASFTTPMSAGVRRSEEHTSELQSRRNLVCRLLLEKKKNKHQKRVTLFIRSWREKSGGVRQTR